MKFDILTIFPHILNSYINESIIKRAQENGAINIQAHNLRDWTTDKHHTVDDTPYGGGAGMVMKVDVLYKALQSLKYQKTNIKLLDDQSEKFDIRNLKFDERKACSPSNIKYPISNIKTALLSAKGKKWNQEMAKEYSHLDGVILICGRYEGVDERISKYVDEEISIGDYVLTGGELGAMVMIDSIARLLPGVLGNEESAVSESHTEPGLLEYPQYTRPEVFIDDQGNEHRVPDVLLSGNHAEIEKWRKNMMKKI